MPAVQKDESKEHYVSRCIPEVMKEGNTQKEAEGKCYGMYDEHENDFKGNRLNKGQDRYGRR